MSLPSTPNNFDIAKAVFESKLDNLKEILSNNQLSAKETVTEIIKTFKDVFLHLKEPTPVTHLLDQYDVRTKELFLKAFRAAKENTDTLLYGQSRLTEGRKNLFNFLQGKLVTLKSLSEKVSNKSLDLSIINNDGRKDVLVAGDDLLDNSLLDTDKGSDVDIVPGTGGAILKRLSVTDLANNVKDVVVEGPSGLYEGKMYGLLSPADVSPEGAHFRYDIKKGRFEKRKVEGVSPELLSRYQAIRAYYESNPAAQERDKVTVGTKKKGYTLLEPEQALIKAARIEGGVFAGLTYEEWEQLAGNFHYERTFIEDVFDVTPYSPREDQDIALTAFTSKITIEHAPDEEKLNKRMKMFDRKPDTYWQAELVIDTKKEFNRVIFDPNRNTIVSSENLEKLLDKVASEEIDRIDLTVSITIELDEPRPVNFISINPVRFHPKSFPTITSIEHSLDGSSFSLIPEVDSGRYETVLSPDINMELDPEEVSFTLASNKFAYSGSAVIPFRNITAKYIRIRIKEEVPYPLIYHIVRVLFDRTVVTKKKKKRFGKVKRKSKTRYYSKSIDLDYPQSLFLRVQELPAEEILPDPVSTITNEEGSLAKETGKTLSEVALAASIALTAVPVAGILGALDLLFKGKLGIGKTIAKALGFGSEVKVQDSGWQFQEAALVPRFDKARYAIGIREIGLFNYKYDTVSTLISKVFVTPKPIDTVALRVDTSFPVDENKDELIKYFFSVDDGTTWNPIAPLELPYITSSFVPQIYRINSEIPPNLRDSNIGYVNTDSPITQIRFKAVLKGVPENNSVTPVLKSYRLILGVKGSL